MTREEYMNQLWNCLYALTPEERQAAIQYYAEYFDDAGPENEQRVIEELGPPSEVAKQILKDLAADRYPPPPIRAGRARRGPVAWWMVLLGVIALPILLPLACALLAVLLALVMVAVILVAVLTVATVVLILAGILGAFGAVMGSVGWGLSIFGGFFTIGEALISLGLGLLLLVLCWWLFSRCFPTLYRRMRRFWRGR